MASDFNKPVSTDNYLDLLTTIRDNQKALAKMFDGETVSNTPVGAIRWSSANGRLEKYNGTTWEALLPVATTSANGLMSSTDKTKLDGIAENANNYIHPTSDGNKHVPATSTTNGRKGLKAGTTAGVFSWSDAMFSFEAVAISEATTIGASHIGKFLRVTSAVPLTVPAPTSLGLRNGESFTVCAGIDGVTIVRNASVFAGASGNADLILSANEYIQLTVISTTTWQVIILPTVATSAETITGALARKYTTPAGVKAAIDASAYILTKDKIEAVLTGSITSHTHSSASESAAGIVELATTAEAATGTDTSRAVTAAGIRAALNASGDAPMSACRAWVNFDGTPASVTPNGNLNVSSVTKTGAGTYTVNFTNKMPDANYAVVLSGVTTSVCSVTTSAADRVAVTSSNIVGAALNNSEMSVAVFR